MNSTQPDGKANRGRAATDIWLTRTTKRRSRARSTSRRASGSAPAHATIHEIQIDPASP
jgi:hypothetical protein